MECAHFYTFAEAQALVNHTLMLSANPKNAHVSTA
jgi:hypothetical protein